MTRLLTIILTLFLATTAPVAADDPNELMNQFAAAFSRSDYGRAHELVDEYLALRPNDPTMLYNQACIYAKQRESHQAINSLRRAIDAGFSDYDYMQIDPDLDSVRTHPLYRALAEKARKAPKNVLGSAPKTPAVQLFRNEHGDDIYRYERDEQRNLDFASAINITAHNEMRRMIEREADHLIETLFQGPPPDDVLIVAPTPEHADKYLKGDASVGGIYDHSQRILVTRDIGASLRHEFFHVMHYGDMERLQQRHPLWIQEGLAALYEDYEFESDGTIRFLPNERTNVVRNRARRNRLMRWENLAEFSDQRFMRLATDLYPQVRSMFEFIAERGKLRDWYRAYIDTFHEDPNGFLAIERAFEKSAREIEHEYRRWAKQLPIFDNRIEYGDGALGVVSDEYSAGDGVTIKSILPGSAASRSRLRVGDVIVAVDDRPTRSGVELANAIGRKDAGDRVKIRARRGEHEYFTFSIALQPLTPTR